MLQGHGYTQHGHNTLTHDKFLKIQMTHASNMDNMSTLHDFMIGVFMLHSFHVVTMIKIANMSMMIILTTDANECPQHTS